MVYDEFTERALLPRQPKNCPWAGLGSLGSNPNEVIKRTRKESEIYPGISHSDNQKKSYLIGDGYRTRNHTGDSNSLVTASYGSYLSSGHFGVPRSNAIRLKERIGEAGR
jgi:hypothetical protein